MHHERNISWKQAQSNSVKMNLSINETDDNLLDVAIMALVRHWFLAITSLI